LKRNYALGAGSGEVDSWARIQRDQIHFATQPAQQLRCFPGVFRSVVHAPEQHVFERDPLPGAQGKLSRSGQEHLQIPLLVQRHELRSQRVIRSIQRDRQLGTDLLFAKVMDAGHDSSGRYGHAALRNPNALNQQSRRLHKILVVQERFAHAHENQVDAILGRENVLIFQHGANLPHKLTGGQVALHSEQRGQAELAVDCTAHLAGDADGRASSISHRGGVYRSRVHRNRVEWAFRACVKLRPA